MAGLVMPWMLSRRILRWRLAPPLPRPLPPLPPAGNHVNVAMALLHDRRTYYLRPVMLMKRSSVAQRSEADDVRWWLDVGRIGEGSRETWGRGAGFKCGNADAASAAAAPQSDQSDLLGPVFFFPTPALILGRVRRTQGKCHGVWVCIFPWRPHFEIKCTFSKRVPIYDWLNS